MIPIRDTVRSARMPVVTCGLIVANVLAFVYMTRVAGSVHPLDFERWVRQWAIVPVELLRFRDLEEGVTLFTSMFLHGGVLHLIGNMWFLWIFGDNVEDRFGHAGFLAFYLFCGLCAGAAQVFVSQRSFVPILGASGAVAGVLGAYLVLFPRARVLTLVPIFLFAYFVELPAVTFLFIWLVFQNLVPATIARSDALGGGVAYWAHIGGFAVGAAIAWLLKESLARKRPVERRPPPQLLTDWEKWSRRQRAREWYDRWRR